MAKGSTGTYVYCVIADARRPKLTRVPAGLRAAGPVRFLDLERGLYAVVADVPLARYGERAIERGLSDLDWVSRAAVAHEAVIESFIDADAVLPMKLFTIFNSDQRVLEHMHHDRARIDALVTRLANHQEWGVRVMMGPPSRHGRSGAAGPASRGKPTAVGRRGESGIAFLSRKKAQRDASIERAERARDTAAALYDRLAAKSRLARRRGASELPARGGPLLLDAAFLVPRSRAKTFQALAAREARALSRQGYGMTLSGPWPPYTFIQD